MPIYAALGVEFCWLIDPILQTLETNKLYEGQWLLQHSLKDDQMVFSEHEFCLDSLLE